MKMDVVFEGAQTPETPEIDLIKEALLLLRSSPPDNVHIVSPAPTFVHGISISPPLLERLQEEEGEVELFPSLAQSKQLFAHYQSTVNIIIRHLQEDKTTPMKLACYLLSWQLRVPFTSLQQVGHNLQEKMTSTGEVCFTEYQKYVKLVSTIAELCRKQETNLTDLTILNAKSDLIHELLSNIASKLHARNWEGNLQLNMLH
jgi:hypothetical protein